MSEGSTTRLQLAYPVKTSGELVDSDDHLKNNWIKIDNNIPPTVCTSGTRPSVPFDGQLIWETDTKLLLVRNVATSEWIRIGGDPTLILVKGIKRTSDDTATSGTTEKVFLTAPSADLEANRTYKVTCFVRYTGSVTAQHFTFRLREDNLTGTVLINGGGIESHTIDIAGSGYFVYLEGLYTPVSAVSKVFVATIVRQSGSGTGTVLAGTIMDVEKKGTSGIYSTV